MATGITKVRKHVRSRRDELGDDCAVSGFTAEALQGAERRTGF